MIVGGGVAFFIFGFFKWLTMDGYGDGPNVFDFFWTGTLPWILIIGSAVLTFLLVSGTLKNNSLPWQLIILAACGLGALLLLIRLLFNPIDGPDAITDQFDRGIGMIVSTIAGVVAAAGAAMWFTSSGGKLADLTDPDKIKQSFGQGGHSGGQVPPPPPPPHGGHTPPPPPPPPSR